MLIDIPECKRCMFCFPLRFGILTFGYLNLIFSILVIIIELWLGYGFPPSEPTMSIYRGVNIYTQMWLPILLYTLEIIFNILLLIGTHIKRAYLIRAYYYYGITTTLAAFLIFILIRHHRSSFFESFYLFEFSFTFCGFVIQIYLLLLIRSELNKHRYQERMVFVNHLAEITVDRPPGEDGTNPF